MQTHGSGQGCFSCPALAWLKHLRLPELSETFTTSKSAAAMQGDARSRIWLHAFFLLLIASGRKEYLNQLLSAFLQQNEKPPEVSDILQSIHFAPQIDL